MSQQGTFVGFFSYAHHDKKTDPELIEALTTDLENRVNAKLTNATFTIWRDDSNIRTGEKWAESIVRAVETADIFIILLSPKWIDSDWCRREYETFEVTEVTRGFEYVAPLMARDISRQSHHLTTDQKSVLERLERRQYATISAINFLQLQKHERTAVIDKVADDIEGMIERARTTRPSGDAPDLSKPRQPRPLREFRGVPHNYSDVDFVSTGEVVLRRRDASAIDIYAQIDFIERLYVQGQYGRVEFGVRRAYLLLESDESGKLSRSRELSSSRESWAYYVKMQDAKIDTIGICIDPTPGKVTLSDLSLPVSDGENRYSHVATADGNMSAENIYAELSVSLTPTDLMLVGERPGSFTPAARAKIEAIMAIATAKAQTIDSAGRIKRFVEVLEERA
jgi:hypothetical protein